jgi:hypothetical protein
MLRLNRRKTLFSGASRLWKRINRPLVTSRKYKIIVLLLIVTILFILMVMMIVLGISSIVSSAAEKPSGLKELPSYPKVIVGSEWQMESLVNEVPVTTILFCSTDPIDKIIKFYEEGMIKKRWKVIYPGDKSQLKKKGIDISQIPQIDPEKGSFLALKKGDITYSIVALKSPPSGSLMLPLPHNLVTPPLQEGVSTVYIRRTAGEISYGSPTEDAPGKEVANVSRYPKTIRKAYIELGQGEGGIALIYESKDGLERIVDFYRRDMAQRGWRAMPLPQEEESKERLILFQNREGEGCLVCVTPSEEADSFQIVILYQKRGF